MQSNIDTVNDLYAAFARGDTDYILERFATTADSDVIADAKRRAPWHFRFAGRDGTATYFQALLGALEPVRFTWGDLAAAGDWVYATVQQEYKVRATGERLVMRDNVHRFRVRDGKVLEWHAHEDTALSCEATGK